MKKTEHMTLKKQKRYLTAGVVSLTALVAMVGLYYSNVTNEEGRTPGEVQLAELPAKEQTDPVQEAPTETAEAVTEAVMSTHTEPVEEIQGEAVTETWTAAPELSFSADDSLSWPVQGDIIMNYSMDKSIYFATLDQYRYHPALVIASQVNDKVRAAADGRVTDIQTTEETGLTVTMDIGDGYLLSYGQLKEVELQVGDQVEKGQLIGFISEPTKYYSVEGSNLYFRMSKDGEPQNPMDYLE